MIRKAVGNVLKGVGCLRLIKKESFELGLEFGERGSTWFSEGTVLQNNLSVKTFGRREHLGT